MARLCGHSAVTLRTALSLDECRERLAAAADAERRSLLSWSGYAGLKPILWKSTGDGFRLQTRIFYRNSFRRRFYARLLPSEDGTIVEGYFSMCKFAKSFLVLWRSFLVLILISLVCVPGPIRPKFVMAAICLGLITWSAVLVKFSQWLGKKDEERIIAFLEKSLKPETPGNGAG